MLSLSGNSLFHRCRKPQTSSSQSHHVPILHAAPLLSPSAEARHTQCTSPLAGWAILPHLHSSGSLPGPRTYSHTWCLLNSKEHICLTYRASARRAAISRKSRSVGSPKEAVSAYGRNRDGEKGLMSKQQPRACFVTEMSQCRIQSSHGRGIHIAAIMSESLEMLGVLEHCCYNLQLWNAKLCKG